MKHAILCVDDEVDNVDALERLFRKKFKVFKATSGPEAISILDENPVTVIISDQRMPEMTGVEFLSRSLKIQPNTIRILLTGYTDIDSVIDAINSGQVYRYVTKPWDPVDLTTAVDRAVERYELQEEIKRKNIELEKALEELKSLDAAKMNFMYLVNHELKTPLTAILSFVELLGESNMDPEQELYVDRISKSSYRLKRLVEDVLQIVSAETGQIKIKRETCLLKDLIEPIPKDVQNLIEKKDLKVKKSLKKVHLKADPKAIRNVTHRLWQNAAKFTPEGETIQITCKVSKGNCTLTFSNSSDPIPEDRIKQLLEPFTIDEDFMNHSQGTGLGLAVSQSLLKLHGSSLDIKFDNGAIYVEFTLPIADK